MEFIQPPTRTQIIAKIIWDNLIQFLAFIVVLILLILRWSQLTFQVKIGAITIMVMFFIIRFSVAYQSLKFEKEIEKDKNQGKTHLHQEDI